MRKIFKFKPHSYHTDIQSVNLVGSFNQWNTGSMPMTFDESEQCWKYEIDLPQGSYAYKFVVNGLEWLHDRYAERFKQNEVGSLDSIALLREKQDLHGMFFPRAPGIDDVITIYSNRSAGIIWSVNGWHPSARGYLRDDIPNLEINTEKMVFNPESGYYEIQIGPFNKRKIPETLVYNFVYEDGVLDDNKGDNYWLPVDLKISGQCFVDSIYSSGLQSDALYRIYLPGRALEGKPCPLLIMLHGYGGNHISDWTQSDIVKMFADRYGMIVVWVNGNILAWGESVPSWYINSPAVPSGQMEDYIMQELIPHIESKYICNGTRFIGGISMGGFGAFYLAIHYPCMFKAAASFSAIYSLYKYRHIDALKKLVGSEENWSRDLYNSIKKVRDCSGTDFYFIVGDEERGALRDNFNLKLAMEKYGIINEFRIYPGDHTNNFWRRHIQEMMEFFVSRL